MRDELIQKTERWSTTRAIRLGNKALKPEEIYEAQRRRPGHLIVIFGEFFAGLVGSSGRWRAYTFENATVLDEANHAEFKIRHEQRPGQEALLAGRPSAPGEHCSARRC